MTMTKSEIDASNLKVILHSKRANIYYLEKCRVMQKDGRVLYLTEGKRENQYWNIPIANTTVLLLGMGTSITQAAMRMLSMAGVMDFAAMAGRRCFPAWKLNGSARRVNTGQQSMCKGGCPFGFRQTSGWRQRKSSN